MLLRYFSLSLFFFFYKVLLSERTIDIPSCLSLVPSVPFRELVQFSCSVVSDSLQPHGHRAHQASLSITNSRSLLKLMSTESVMHPTISSSVIPFSSCLQSFPASESFPMSQFFTSGGQSIGASASESVPSKEYSGLIKRLSLSSFRVVSSAYLRLLIFLPTILI